MKRIVAGTVFLMVFVSVLVSGAGIEVRVNNLDSEKGQVVIGLYDAGEKFPETGKEVQGLKLELGSDKPKGTFSSLAPGDYAVSLFHDVNGNGKLDKNFMGIPTEGYGFSKNAYNWYGGAPEFDQASFELEKGETVSLEIKIKNWPPV
jgi:uncharacterized protein (DUF2141 family)